MFRTWVRHHRLTDRRKSPPLSRLAALESRLAPATLTFRDGVDGYAGTQDTVLYSLNAGTNFGNDTLVSVDAQDSGGARQGLIRFDGIFGTGPNQIPLGSTITSASLTVWNPNESDANATIGLYRMAIPWGESTATWFSLNNGVRNDGSDAAAILDAKFPAQGKNSFLSTGDLRATLQDWANGADNHGWAIFNDTSNGWDFHSSENANVSQRPELRVDFEPPDPVGGGLFAIAQSEYLVNESGGNLVVTVQRVGGASGTAGVTLETVDNGTAVGGSDYTKTAKVLSFAPNVLRQTVTIPIVNDTLIEGAETFGLQLADATGTGQLGGFGTAIVTILDNDALLNEINVNPPGTDNPFEYIELRGTPNASLAGVYLIQLEGDSSAGPGTVDVSISLASAKFGANGLLVLKSPSGGFAISAETAVLTSSVFDTADGGLENGSSTFLLVRSSTPIAVNDDLDIDDNGLLELPGDAAILDNIGWTDGGSSDKVYNGLILTPVSSRVAAASRFAANDTASNASAWFGGNHLETTNDAVTYNLTQSTGNTPPGAKLTPGAVNGVPTSFAFAKADYAVDETGGSIVITVNRLGDTSGLATVEYKLVGTTATAGSDYVDATGKLTFAAEEVTRTFTVTVLDDAVAEADEIVTAVLFNPQSGFQAALGNPASTAITIIDNEATRATFQDGVNGYTGAQDTYISGVNPFVNFGAEPLVTVDAGSKSNWGLIRFTDLLGQIPEGAKILGASLTVDITNSTVFGATISLHRMLADWDENASTWESMVNGVLPDDVEAVIAAETTFPGGSGGFGATTIPNLGAAVQSWIDGGQANNGWVILSNNDDAVAFVSSDETDPTKLASRPKLSVSYIPPVGGGFVQFASGSVTVNESAGTATVKVTRNGGTGPADVNFAVTAGTATAADATLVSGKLSFTGTQTVQSFTIPITNDSLIEGSETLNLTLSSPTGAVLGPTPTAVLTIRDDDFDANLRLNEVLTNPPGTDQSYEFVELTGTAKSQSGVVYVVAFRGNGSSARGLSDAVWSLDGVASGTNGLTMIRAASGGHGAAAGTTVVASPRFDLGGPGLTNDSLSLFLIHSPDSVFSTGFDFDWNNDGSLDLPTGATVLDSVGWTDNGLNSVAYGAVNLTQFGYTPDAASRSSKNLAANDPSAWYGGDVIGADNTALAYDPATDKSFNLAVGGPLVTPGSTNYPVPPQVAEFTVGDGTAQRSKVAGLTVTFNTVVNFAGPVASAFEVNRTGPTTGPLAGPTGPVGLIATADTNSGRTVVTITFTGSMVELTGSLKDGNYTFRVFSANVSDSGGQALDGDGDGSAGGDYNQPGGLRRLYGDSNGDGAVNFTDFLVFRSAFGTSVGNPAYLDYLNSNADANIDFTDFLQFRTRFGTSLI